MNGSERRCWARYVCQGTSAAPLVWITTESGRALNTVARDISMGGCAFEVEEGLPLPGLFELNMLLPLGCGALDVESRLAWAQPSDRRLCIGVAFSGLSNQEQHVLGTFFHQTASKLPPTIRQQAIADFERGIFLYYQRQMAQAKRQFQQIMQDYPDCIDIVAAARRYHQWCCEGACG